MVYFILGKCIKSCSPWIYFLGGFFHKYKQLLQITAKEATVIDQDSLRGEMTSLLETKPEGKIMFYRYSKKWYGFLYSLHKEDRLIMLKMVLEVCSYDEDVSHIINTQDFQSPIDFLFFLLTIIL